MTQKKIKLPPRKWYSLQQAADKLTRDSKEPVTVDDLIHYAATLNIELCIKVRKENGLVNFSIFREQQPSEFSYRLINRCFIESTILQVSLWKPVNLPKGNALESSKNSNNLTVNGFLAIKPYHFRSSNFERYLLDKKLSDFYLTNPRELIKENIPLGCLEIIFKNDETSQIIIDYRDIYVLSDELNFFMNTGGKLEIEKGKIRPVESISPRKKANQLEFIKALLKLHCGTDDPNECRNLLSSSLEREFARAGIEVNITPETLRNWLRSEK